MHHHAPSVSIHAPTRGATKQAVFLLLRQKFQSTHPRGVRRNIGTRLCVRSSFNPRTHEGCDLRAASLSSRLLVSIHAPTRGATQGCKREPIGTSVSIHAPTRGATPIIKQERMVPLVSIHAPTRGATSADSRGCILVGVSIHAPTRGATSFGRVAWISNQVSIHAPTRGATIYLDFKSYLEKFQSTHPRGVRQSASLINTKITLFQSTHPRGVRRQLSFST